MISGIGLGIVLCRFIYFFLIFCFLVVFVVVCEFGWYGVYVGVDCLLDYFVQLGMCRCMLVVGGDVVIFCFCCCGGSELCLFVIGGWLVYFFGDSDQYFNGIWCDGVGGG